MIFHTFAVMEQDTICALATPPGGAIAVVRVSGPEAVGITDCIFSGNLKKAKGYSIHFGNVIDADGKELDVSTAMQDALAGAAGDPVLGKVVFTQYADDTIGSQIGKEMRNAAFWAISLAVVAMLVYIYFRFEFGFGIGAIVALAHDVLITIGIFSCLGFQFNLTIVAALLTIVGYGVNDTIVLFDRVREELKRDQKTDFPAIVNRCVNLTLSRTVLTSVTTLIPVVALVVFCSGSIQGFGVCMLIGVVVSTFSSIFIASPVMLAWYRNKRPDFRKPGA